MKNQQINPETLEKEIQDKVGDGWQVVKENVGFAIFKNELTREEAQKKLPTIRSIVNPSLNGYIVNIQSLGMKIRLFVQLGR